MTTTPYGWGLSPWGTYPWGFGTYSTLSILNAFPISNRILHIVLSKEPAHVSPFNVGDALNPRTWLLQRTDTNQYYTTLSVRPGALYLEWDIYVLESLAPYGIPHTVFATSLVDTLGSSIVYPGSASFTGCGAVDPAAKTVQPHDIKNDSQLGMSIDASGDYARQSGVDLLKKLILRRITTAPGEFFYLTDYGLGIRLKEPLSTSDLVKLKAELQRQIMREPDIRSVQVGLSMTTDGILYITVSAVMSSGSSIQTTLEIPAAISF